ncbi:hypothetical protein [Enterobacter cloacae complex sp. 288G10]|uniref:hypothetical protein n=1 Tax=Enterobacter cloacae complex sp. 288G10 TaxID=3395859 RepID=UPI003CF9FCDD
MKELISVAQAALDYIDALPSDMVASLHTMPGFDRDWATEVIADAIVESNESREQIQQQSQAIQLPETCFFDGPGNDQKRISWQTMSESYSRSAGVQFSE